MTEHEFLLIDRIQKIKQIINQYGEDQFYVSFSGGKDSCVLSELIDEALPDNKIPRVYFNTGIEFSDMVKYVKRRQERDDRIVIMKPETNIKRMLEDVGYPFKSKDHSKKVYEYQAKGCKHNVATYKYLNALDGWSGRFACPKILRYQFDQKFHLKISEKCCDRLKKDISKKYSKQSGRPWSITGIRKSEGGARINSGCVINNKKKKQFNPLFPVDGAWVDWYIEQQKIVLCKLYYPPFNFERTGCKGCPYNIKIQDELDLLGKYLPRERESCELIWKPVYDEYRRIGYRLKPVEDYEQMTIEGLINGETHRLSQNAGDPCHKA